jgi:HK97 family phage portal protein
VSTNLIFVDSRDPVSALRQVLHQSRAEIAEQRSSLENPSTPLSFPAEWLLDILNGGRTDSGIRVSEMTALQVSTVFACIQIVSKSLACLPLNVYERIAAKDKRMAKRLAWEHDLFDMLRKEPNDEMSAMTFRKTLQAHALLWGNGYAEIQRDAGNRIVAIWPRNPARTRPVRSTTDIKLAGGVVKKGRLFYRTIDGMDELTGTDDPQDRPVPERGILADDMIHVPGLALDGRLGQSVVQLSRQVVGLALAAEKFGAKLFANNAKPGGILTHPGKLNDKARETLKRSWLEAQGGENAFRTAVLEEGITWKDSSIKPNEGQFLETRDFQRSEICSIFGVPPHMIGDTGKSNRANTEQLGLEFVTFCIQPWATAWEQEYDRKLFPSVGRTANKFFIMHDTRQLTMPDAESRRNFYSSGKQWGFLSTNDIRELEHMNPIDDPSADAYWIPINMEDAAKADAEPTPAPAAQGKEGDDKLGQRFTRAYFRLFRDAFGRILSRSNADSDAFRRAFLPVFLTIGEQLHRIAADEAHLEATTSDDLTGFLAEYVEVMRARADGWKSEDPDAAAERELLRAVKAIAVEVYQAVGTQRAKANTKE